EFEENTVSPKRSFYDQFENEPVVLNFGDRGQETGRLRYNEKDDVLAVERPDGTLNEVTNQDFNDGLVMVEDPSIAVPEDFRTMTDPRTEVKKAETIAKVKERMLDKQKEHEKAKDKVAKLKEKIDIIRNRIKSTSPELLQELSDLEKQYTNLREKVKESSLYKKLYNQFISLEITEEEMNKQLDEEFDRRGGKKISDRISEINKTLAGNPLDSYERVAWSIEELQSVNDLLQEEYDSAVAEQQQLQEEYNVYQELLTTLNPDFNSTLNMVEDQLKMIADLQGDLESHKGRITQLMEDVVAAIRSIAKLVKVKSNLSPTVHTETISRVVDDFLAGRAGSEVLVGLLKGI